MSSNFFDCLSVAFRKIYRISIVGALFGIFGAICLLGNLIFVPMILVRLHRIRACRYFARDLVFLSWKLFVFCTRVCGYMECKFIINEKIPPNVLIVANHPSLLDVVLLLSRIRHINCIVKPALARNVFLFPAIKASGYILNTQNEIMLLHAKNALSSGESLLIFPEGTRTKEKIVFHNAASHIAVHAANFIIPVCIHMYPKSLQKGSKWYNTPLSKIHYSVIVKGALEVSRFCIDTSKPLACRMLNTYLNNFYQEEFRNDR